MNRQPDEDVNGCGFIVAAIVLVLLWMVVLSLFNIDVSDILR